jgi:hypothetical protein
LGRPFSVPDYHVRNYVFDFVEDQAVDQVWAGIITAMTASKKVSLVFTCIFVVFSAGYIAWEYFQNITFRLILIADKNSIEILYVIFLCIMAAWVSISIYHIIVSPRPTLYLKSGATGATAVFLAGCCSIFAPSWLIEGFVWAQGKVGQPVPAQVKDNLLLIANGKVGINNNPASSTWPQVFLLCSFLAFCIMIYIAYWFIYEYETGYDVLRGRSKSSR